MRNKAASSDLQSRLEGFYGDKVLPPSRENRCTLGCARLPRGLSFACCLCRVCMSTLPEEYVNTVRNYLRLVQRSEIEKCVGRRRKRRLTRKLSG